MYENRHDANSAARAIDLYKADKGISGKKTTKKNIDIDAAKSVVTSSKTDNPDMKAEIGSIKESDVEKMSDSEYEAQQDAIIAAMTSGKFIYDLTGGAR